MALTFPDNGATLTDGTEQTLAEITSDVDAYYGACVFVPAAFTGTDSVTIRFYVYDVNATTITGKIAYKKVLLGSQAAAPAFYIPLVPSRRYRLTIEKTAGTNRTFTWHTIKQT